MLTTSHAISRLNCLENECDAASQNLAEMYEEYLANPAEETRQVRIARRAWIRTLVVFAVAFLVSVVWRFDLVAWLIAFSVAMAINRFLDFHEVWYATVRKKGPGSIALIPRMVEMLFSSESRYPYWWYRSYTDLLLLCVFPPVFLIGVSAPPGASAVFVCSWTVMVISMYLQPASPPFAVLSAASSVNNIELVASIDYQVFPLHTVALLDHELIRPEPGESFPSQSWDRYHVVKAHSLIRTRKDWQQVFREIVEYADVLLVDAREIPEWPVRFEVGHIIQHERLLKKTLFIGSAEMEFPLFQSLEVRPEHAMLIRDKDIEIMMWAHARRPNIIRKQSDFFWQYQAIAGYFRQGPVQPAP